ncbi:hypothetical protein BVH75_30395 (plasmid) [Bacillus thuringiensis]|nr:hypothetical protein BVH75_30395 [Bacillus thuringiensis]
MNSCVNKLSKANLFASLEFARNATRAEIKEFSSVINLPNCSLLIGTVCGLLQQFGLKIMGLHLLYEKQSLCFIYFLLICLIIIKLIN